MQEGGEPITRDQWLTYYGACGAYIASLHTQLLAVMTLQGAVAIGTMAAISTKVGAITIGFTGAALEVVFLVLAWKLFVQCGEVCKLMASIEVDHVEIPKDLALKTVLIKKPLFTSNLMRGVVMVAGALFAIALGVAGCVAS